MKSKKERRAIPVETMTYFPIRRRREKTPSLLDEKEAREKTCRDTLNKER